MVLVQPEDERKRMESVENTSWASMIESHISKSPLLLFVRTYLHTACTMHDPPAYLYTFVHVFPPIFIPFYTVNGLPRTISARSPHVCSQNGCIEYFRATSGALQTTARQRAVRAKTL